MFVRSVNQPELPGTSPLELVFVGNRLLVVETGREARLSEAKPAAGEETVRRLYLGSLDGRPCYVRELRRADVPVSSDSPAWTGAAAATEAPAAQGQSAGTGGPSGGAAGAPQIVLRDLRSLMGALDEELLKIAGIASQVLDWDRNHQFCGRCGGPTVSSTTERSRSCPTCELSFYPRISPAVIVGVHREGRILLAHNRRHRGPRPLYSVLAGFVEPGESLEDCVRREVGEEVAIELGEIRYFGSQPWPFPDSLMVGFTACYRAGEIRVDGVEIVEADWFTRENLPPIPPHGTIARRIIDSLVSETS